MVLTDGERWTRVELERLRAAGWRPGAMVAFLVAAQARTGETRRARPALARQEARWLLAGAGAWIVVVRWWPGDRRGRMRLRGLGWWALCGLMLDWHLGMLETPDGRPVGLGGADAITLTRAWLVPAVAETADPWLVGIGALTDIADGRVARATRTTRFGRDLEGLVDATFFLAGLSGVVRAGGLSRRVANLERARLAAGTAYVTGSYFLRGRAPEPTVSRAGRVAAPVRVAALIAAGAGRRRLAGRLLLGGTAGALGALISSRARRHPAPAPPG